MKTLICIFIAALPIMAKGQFHATTGINETFTGKAYKVGYSDFVDWFGTDVSIRKTETPQSSYTTFETIVKAKYSFMSIGFGTAFDFNVSNWHFLFTLRNELKLSKTFSLIIDYDQTFRGETYIMGGISLNLKQ